jgi:hypothetical protein
MRTIQHYYKRLRESGMGAAHSHDGAKAWREFSRLENLGLVRLIAEDEQESYFDVYGEPDDEKEREQIARAIETYGNYCIHSEYRQHESAEWEWCDSVGMCAGYKNVLDPCENWYVIDLMSAAVQAASANNYTI